MQKGKVIKTYNSFFYVQTEKQLISCKMRGKFKKKTGIYLGDWVDVCQLEDGTGVIEHIFPRHNLLKRPAVANIDQVILVFAAMQPNLHWLLLNRFLVLAEWSRIDNIIICVNKMDLCKERDMLSLYRSIGYPVLCVSAKEQFGIESLKSILSGHSTVFAGPSGVGKSSLLNCLDESFSLATGEVSEKIKRGKHTTRVAQIIPYQDGYVVDTPGFSAMELADIGKQDLAGFFPEFGEYVNSCYFSPCSHTHEPNCSVKEAVRNGSIATERYEAYRSILSEIEERKRGFK